MIIRRFQCRWTNGYEVSLNKFISGKYDVLSVHCTFLDILAQQNMHYLQQGRVQCNAGRVFAIKEYTVL